MNPGISIRFDTQETHKNGRTLGERRAFYLFPMNSEQSGDVIAAATTNATFDPRVGPIICRLHDPFADQLGFFPFFISAGGGSGCTRS
jgi:hypothetical protein